MASTQATDRARQDGSLDVESLCAADSLFDSEFGRRIKAADKDGDGRLSVGEFRSVVWSEIEGWKRARHLRTILVSVTLFTLLVLGANIAMAVTVAHLSKDIKVGSDGIMTLKNGKGFVATGQAATAVDLADAYTLSVDKLRMITHVIVPDTDGTTTILQVQQIKTNPRVAVTFYMAGGSTLTSEQGGLTLGSTNPGGSRRLLQTQSATGVSSSSSALSAQDEWYGYGY